MWRNASASIFMLKFVCYVTFGRSVLSLGLLLYNFIISGVSPSYKSSILVFNLPGRAIKSDEGSSLWGFYYVDKIFFRFYITLSLFFLHFLSTLDLQKIDSLIMIFWRTLSNKIWSMQYTVFLFIPLEVAIGFRTLNRCLGTASNIVAIFLQSLKAL